MQVDRASIRQAPEFDPDAPVTRDTELALYRHYRKGPYWRDE